MPRRAFRLGCVIGTTVALSAWEPVLAEIINLTQLSGGFEVSAEAQRQKFESPNGGKRTYERNRFEEEVEFALYGSVVTPELATFKLGGKFGLRQEDFKSSDADSGKTDGDINGYDATLNFLPRKVVSLTLFGNRFQDSALQGFGSNIETISEALGASVNFGIPSFPSVLTIQRLDLETDSRGGGFFNHRNETREVVEFSGQHFSELVNARLRLREEDVDQEDLVIDDTYRFRQADGSFGVRWGPYLEKSWRMSARYFERTGTYDFENIGVSSDLDWDPTETLTTQLTYDYSNYRTRNQRTTTNSGTLGLSHELYESLRSGFSLFVDKTQQDAGDRGTYGVNGSLSYRKKMPWRSRLTGNVAFRYRVDERDVDGEGSAVASENLTISGFTDNMLAMRRIDPASIEVFESSGGLMLIRDIDYTTDVIGDFVSIDILSGGSISVGDTLFVSYELMNEPDYEIAVSGFRYGIGWDTGDWFRARYEHSEAEEKVLKGERNAQGDRDRDSLRLEFHTERRRIRASAGLLLIRDRMSSAEYDEISLTQDLKWEPSKKFILVARLRESRREFKNLTRTTQAFTAGTTLSWRLRKRGTVRLFGTYRNLDDTDSLDQDDLEIGMRGSFRYGKIELTPTAATSWSERGKSTSRDFRVRLGIRRRF